MNSVPLIVVGSLLLAINTPAAPAAPETGISQTIVIRQIREKKNAELDWLIHHPSLFTATREEFKTHYPKGSYVWLDKEKSRARFNPDRTNIKLSGEEMGETIVSFKDDKISAVLVSVVNKGDDGLIKEGPYKKAIATATGILKAVAKVTASPRNKNETVSKAEGLVWSTKQAMYMLEHLWVPEERRDGLIWYAHAEFVRIRILPPQVLLGMQQNTMKVNISRPTLAKRVKKEGSKVWLEGVPMVDQGSKGYCAVASFERVMRYYGSQVDMHDLAELANANGMFGTSPEGIKDAVHKMAVRSGLRTREPFYFQGKDFKSMIGAYNREAKKSKLGEVDMRGLSSFYREMEPDLFKTVRMKDSGYNKFAGEVARSINAGIPLMWALQLGVFWEDGLEDSYEANRNGEDEDKDDEDDDEEKKVKKTKPTNESPSSRPKRPPEEMSGGHMRLIIGYDPTEKVIYYTDSWGPGHEMKKMTLEEAWTITMGVFILEP